MTSPYPNKGFRFKTYLGGVRKRIGPFQPLSTSAHPVR